MKLTNAKEFGIALKNRRKSLGYTQKFLSEFTGFSVSFISGLENRIYWQRQNREKHYILPAFLEWILKAKKGKNYEKAECFYRNKRHRVFGREYYREFFGRCLSSSTFLPPYSNLSK